MYADFPWRPGTCWKTHGKSWRANGLDMIVANNLKVEGAGFGVSTNVATLITKDDVMELPLMGKDEVAEKLLDAIEQRRSAQ